MPKKKEKPKSKKVAEKIDPEIAERQALTKQIEGDLPYERTIYINEARRFLKRSIEDILTVGKLLLIIQEKEGHGDFGRIVEDEIGLPRRTAYRFMNAAMKAEKYPAINLCQLAQVSKVYALLEAPEEELKKFEQLGLFAGKDRDELMSMSHTDLRKLVEDLRDNTDEIVKGKTDEIRRLNKQLQKERDELYSMVPTAPDGSWAEKPLSMIQEAFIRLDNLLSSFAFDPSIIGNDKLQAKVEGFRVEMEKRSVLFIERWEEHTGKKVGK
ncbi:MAG: hypothetical protein HZA11_09260 [Nitrospirae bacterium]|nr:hypothetical protein [Nitrospirota bacterium]